MMVASMVILRACITLVNISSQMVQVLGFIRLGRTPKARNGAEITPRSGTGRCICSQHPLQNLEFCRAAIVIRGSRIGWPADPTIGRRREQGSATAAHTCRLAERGKAARIASKQAERRIAM